MKMKPLSLETIAEVTGGKYIGPESEKGRLITGVVRDNRHVQPGNLFVCIKGERVDGHDFAPSAFASGAYACLAEKELNEPGGPYILVASTLLALKALSKYYRSLFDIPVVGITGSVGKTTAKEMTASVLAEKYKVLKTPENLNNEIGVPLTILSLREEHEAAVIEMGISDLGEMSRLADIVRPDICLMTTIGYCHLEALHDLNGVLKAKSEVYSFMPKGGIAVVNGDDEMLSGFDPGIKKVTFGYGKNNDFRAENLKNNGFDGITCDIILPDGVRFNAEIPAFGSHIALAALAAAAIGSALGLSSENIRNGFKNYLPVGGRADVQKTDYITVINDCYNANPNSVTASLLSLCSLPGRRVAILGDMKELGTSARELHREIGALAGNQGLDCLICCGNMAEFIYKGLISSGCTTCQAWNFPMKEALFSVLPSLIKKGDTVLVKASHSMHFEEIVEELKKLR